ncbi:mucin-12-like isoform X2 [Anopheles albimanus]|uniref:mucin-12-like isoform X2 n=1 Tax=Anopheles albimanus TaxID=7167 RepID=UPI00164122E2|nr:mucin-12-like isoform X2 [Anopheles albimanus]
MDYIGRTMNICLILFMISITGSRCQYYSNRDIILTPNHLKTYPGKVLYYRPRDHAPTHHHQEDQSDGAVPWEEVLKETVFLALNDNKTSHQQQPSGSTLDNAPLLAKRQQKAIYNAPYIGAVDLSVPRFGDIVELAHGRLEREGEDGESYYFIQQQEGEQQQHRLSKRNVTALWMVERIRHRDDLRGHRYELKFTVAPVVRTNNMTNAIDNEMHSASYEEEELAKAWGDGNRTFIIRDEDYPKYFGAIVPPNANVPTTMHRKNDQAMYDRMFFDLQPQHSYGAPGGAAFSQATRFFRPAVVQPQQTITLGQYLVQSLLSGGESPKYHHHQHHMVPTKFAYPGSIYAATSNRIKFPDSFNTASQNVPKYYHHIHFPRPSIAPLAPTAVPGSFLIQHAKDSAAPVVTPNANSLPQQQLQQQQDYTKLADHRGAAAINAAISGPDSLEARPNTVQQVIHKPSSQPSPVQNAPQQQQQQKQRPLQFTPHQSQVATTPYGAAAHQTPTPQQQQQQTPPHIIYRQQQQQQQQQQPPFMIHPNAHSPFAGPAGPFLQPIHAPQHASHLIQSIPFYNPQGQMVLNHIPVMSNHHLIQMSPPQPIAIPVHVQLIPPPHIYAPAQHQHPQQQQQQQQSQQSQQPSPTHPQHPQDGLQAIPKVAGGVVTVGPTVPTTNRHTPLVQLSGPSIGPSTPHQQQQQRHRFSATPTASSSTGTTAARGSSSTAPITFPSSTPSTRASVRYTSAIGQVSGPTAASSIAATANNHRYSPSYAAASLPTVPASPAGLREKFTATATATAAAAAAAFHQQQAASESKQSARKLEPPAAPSGASSGASDSAAAADAVGSPSNAVSPKYESFGVENAVTPTNIASIASSATATAESLLLRSPSSTASSAAFPSSTFGVSVSHHSPASSSYGTAASPAPARPSSYGTTSAFSYSNFIDASGAVSVTGKLVSEPVTRSRPPTTAQSTTPTISAHPTTQATFVPKPKSYIQQLGPTIGVKYPPAFKSMPSVTILPPQIETPISSTLKTYQYLNHHHDTYDFIPSRVVELAHVKKMAGQKHAKRNKQKAGGGGKHGPGGSNHGGSQGNHHMQQHQQHQQHQQQQQQHHHVTVTSNKPLRFYPGDGPEFATHRPEAQLSVQLPPPEKEFAMTYYGTPKHNQKVQRPKNYVTPLQYQAPSSTTPMPAVVSTPSASSTVSSTVGPSPAPSASLASTTPEPTVPRNTSASTFRSATASSTAHYYKNRHEKSDDLSITTMRPRMILKTIYRQFPGSFVSTSTMTSASTEKPIQKWVPKRPRTKSTSGEYSTSTLPSNRGSDTVVASSDHSPDVVTKNPVVPVTVQQPQMSPRARASRGRSRYTYRRIPSGNPPPIPTGQQAIRIGRMRNGSASSTTTTTTTTIKPVPVVTSSVFDSNRIDTRSFEQQERKAEETVMETTTPVEKIKRDATEELVDELALADQMVARQVAENKHDALEITEPEKEYVMVKANVTPVNTNEPNVVFFEASDATDTASGAGAGIGATKDSPAGRSLGSAIEDLTMSIINHAKAIVNETEQESEVPETTTAATTTTSTTTSKSVESNEISQKVEQQETIDTTENEIDTDMFSQTESVTSHGVTESASETTIATTPATTLDDVELRDDEEAKDDSTKRTTVKDDLSK